MILRPIGPEDLDAVLALNQDWVPHVGSLDAAGLARLVDMAVLAAVIDGAGGELDAFVIALGPGADYASPNYRWFSERHEDFCYVDRIAVRRDARGAGHGRRLYDGVAAFAGAIGSPVVCAEVNVTPPNPESLAFHTALGFSEVGRQWTYDDTVEVALLERAV